MKKWLLTAALVALCAPAALAQGNGRDRDRHPGGGQGAAPAAAPAQAAPAAQPPRTGAAFRGEARIRNNQGNNVQPNQGGMMGPRPGGGMAGPRPNNNNFAGPRPNNNNFAGPRPGARRDFSALHRTFTAPRRFRIGAYHRPPGFYVHHWTFGEILPSAFWASNYWLNDYFDFGLTPPPPGTMWVRYGSDALLIDRYSGEVIQVAYNVFY